MEFNEIEERMDKSISVFEENLSEIRAGRANPAILNKITVDYYGVPTPINQVAGISVPEGESQPGADGYRDYHQISGEADHCRNGGCPGYLF